MECESSANGTVIHQKIDNKEERKRKAIQSIVNSCSKVPSTSVSDHEVIDTKKPKNETSSPDIREMARRTLLDEIKRAGKRVEKIGPQGWKKPFCLHTNKEFLARTLKSTLRRRERSPKRKKDTKF